MRTLLSIVFALSVFAAGAIAAEQPLPFSHKAHAGTMKLKCAMCHPNKDPGETMQIAGTAVCMQCHVVAKKESPAIEKLAALAAAKKEVKWRPVYRIPSYVNFSHRAHLTAGNKCAECHGPVAERAALIKEGDISMGGCMNCHRMKKASLDCGFCHEPRN